MSPIILSLVFALMAGALFYTEQHDSSFNAQTLSSGWFAIGMMLRITLIIVMVVLLAISMTALFRVS